MATEIIWTALPERRKAGQLALSAHVAPRLTTAGGDDATLADFPVLAAWPPGDLAFEVLIDGGAHRLPATIVSAPPDPTVWSLLFPSTCTVASHEVVDRSQLPIHTYPVTKVAAWLRDRYAQAAIDSGEDFPAIDDLLATGWDDIRFSGRDGRLRWDAQRAVLEDTLASARVVDTAAPSTPTFDFFQLEDFFAPVDISQDSTAALLQQPVEPPTLDFHAVLQFVNQHPPLLRTLGLVFDLVVHDRAGVITTGNHTVQVVPISEHLVGVAHRQPKTQCEVTSTAFRARPRPGSTHLADGFLRFEDTSQFQALQVETDGGAIKAGDRANNLMRIKLHPTEDTPDTAALPTLRADGISVARVAQGKYLHDKLVLGPSLEADLQTDALEVYADDLIRGVRVDVLDVDASAWSSLMQRTGQYELDGGNVVLPVSDEGFIVTNATKKVGSDDLYATEEVFHWDGWSLAAARPGKVLNIDPTGDPLIDRQNEPGAEFDARFHFDATPGTLPALRYGREYRLRARTVDLAGNSIPLGDPDAAHATPPVRYGRLEPPQTPPVLLRDPKGPGESMETVVLRSNYDAPPEPIHAQRHLAPPKVGQLMAELHGVLDVPDPSDPTRMVLDKGKYSLLVARDAATLENHDNAEVDPADNADARYYPVDQLEVTWTPEPAMETLALKLLDGPNAGHLTHGSLFAPGGEQNWPGQTCIRLVVTEGVGAPSFDALNRVLTVPLRKGDLVHARLSGVLDPARLAEHTLWSWVEAALPAGPAGEAKKDELLQLIADGQHWMLEPYRMLTLVHATRQPVARPEFPQPPTASRPPAATFAQLAGTLSFHRRSTERVDVLADWEDPVDDGPDSPDDPAFVGDPGTRKVERQTAVTIQVEHGDDLNEDELDLRHRHEIGDTKHHVVTYRAVASSRFTEFFTSTDTITYDGAGAVVVLDTGTPTAGVVKGSVKLTHTDADGKLIALIEGKLDPSTNQVTQDFAVDAEAGSITFGDGTSGRMPDPGDPLRVAYLVPPFTRETADPAVEVGEFGPRTISVPSSVRPSAPRVRYAIPAFRWESSDVSQHDLLVSRTSSRHGQLLRVYLERPWWSSGVGELLGVLTWPDAEKTLQPDLDEEDPLRPFVTQWGEDPIFDQRPLNPRYPRLASFPRAVATDTGLTLKELGGSGATPVSVAGHEVGFDADRNLWYADIEVQAGDAYVPFVRLALTRWQPDSIANAELSPVVLADFVQLAPDRSATVVFDDVDRSILGVTLTGPTHLGSEVSGTHPGNAQVIVEKRDANLTGDLAWTQLGQPIAMNGSVSNGIGQWFAEIHLDEPPAAGQLRLVIEQSERLAEEPTSSSPHQFNNPSITVQPIPVDRLVFTDIIPL